MFLTSLIEEFCTKKENNKASCTLTFGGQYSLMGVWMEPTNLYSNFPYISGSL